MTNLNTIQDGIPAVIGWFDDFDGPNPYGFLSNFYVSEPIYIRSLDDEFMTGEHAFAAMKARDVEDYNLVRDAFDPAQAKMYGRMLRLRPDWEEVKYDAMLAVIRAKFTLQREEGQLLLSTGDALLIEGTYWDDEVWGVSVVDENPLGSPGRNWLGTMLMARRAELRAEDQFGVSHPTGRANSQFVVRGR